MEMTPVKSSNINSIGYDEKERELFIEFKSGKTFKYCSVSTLEFEEFKTSKSIGSHFFKFIKSTKDCKEVVVEKGKPQKDTIVSTQAETIKDLQAQLDSFRKSMVTIERIAIHPPADLAILEVVKRALEVDKANNSM